MNFKQFVWRNTHRNKHLYLAYFLSTLFTVMVFFTFMVFAFHPALLEELQNFNEAITKAMFGSAAIIYIFSFFFVMYSMDIFLQSRKKEFGTFMMQGMSPKQLKKMVFQENLVIGFFATLCGLLVGIIFSQVILLLSEIMLYTTLKLYFPKDAILVTFISFMILFLLISIFIHLKLPKLTLQDLLKSDKYGKGDIKSSSGKAIWGIILLMVGYIITFYVSGQAVVLVMFPVIILVIIGTKLLFDQFTVFFVKKYKGKKNLFWKKTNLIVFSDLSFRMKDNSRAFFLVAIISTVAITATASLYNLKESLTATFNSTLYEFTYSGSEEEIAAFTTDFEKSLSEHQVEAKSIVYEYLSNDEYFVISETQYNQLANFINQDPADVKGQSIVILGRGEGVNNKIETNVTIEGITLVILEEITSKVFSRFNPTIIVSDNDYEQLVGRLTNHMEKIWEPTNGSEEQIVAVGKDFISEFDFQANTRDRVMILNAYMPVLFVGLFIGVVFFVAASSFLYTRLFSDIEVDIQKFRMVNKVGLTNQELKKMISRQVRILFFTPIVVALMHATVALTAMNSLFGHSIQLIDVQVLGIFLFIQIIYYLICRHFYYRRVAKEVLSS